jgi:DNA-binding beta-propeller fold protein YncE
MNRLLLSLMLCGCGEVSPQNPTVLPGPSRGSAVALSADDSIAVVVNRDTSSVTVLSMRYDGTPAASKVAEITVGREPWQAAISPDGDTAYVVTRRDQRLVRIDHLKSAPQKGASVQVGSEPTSVALTPTGAQAWVANWVDGTLSAVDTKNMTIAATVDLNAALAGSGLLGQVAARPALAHPRSLAITNDGDAEDGDETLLATEYFAQRKEAERADGSNADLSRQGVVYRVKLADKSVGLVALAPLADMGFRDHNGGVAGCYPNQLQGISISGTRAYVTSVCASPRGPLGIFDSKKACAADSDCEANGGKCDTMTNVCAVNPADVKTATAPLVSVIDLSTETQVASSSLNAAFDAMYRTQNTPDDASRRLPLLANEIAFVGGTGIGYTSASGADAVFRLVYDGAELREVGSSANSFINLTPPTQPELHGKNPIGIAVTQADHGGRVFALVANDVTRNLSVVDLATQSVTMVSETAPLPAAGSAEEHQLKGKRFFVTGTGRWSLKAQAWNACQSCHVDGLSDNVTWYFARGPRQSTSLDGSFSKKDANDQRIFNWTAIFDEIADFEGNTRGVSGGIGATVKAVSTPPTNADRIDLNGLGHGGLNGSALSASLENDAPDNFSGFTGQLDDWSEITEWVKTIRPPRRPTNLDSTSVESGRALFAAGNCQGCHGGDKWTISRRFYTPDKNVATIATNLNAKLATTAWAPPSGFPAALLPAATNRLMRFGDAAKDQIQCILRPVGTFGVAESDVAESGAFPELRVDMKATAQGAEADGNGYNPPSLLGGVVGAPYLHAGQARTLEALFSPTFKTHFQSLNAIFLDPSDSARADKVAQLIQFLLAIDGDEPAQAIPAAGSSGGDFCAPPM